MDGATSHQEHASCSQLPNPPDVQCTTSSSITHAHRCTHTAAQPLLIYPTVYVCRLLYTRVITLHACDAARPRDTAIPTCNTSPKAWVHYVPVVWCVSVSRQSQSTHSVAPACCRHYSLVITSIAATVHSVTHGDMKRHCCTAGQAPLSRLLL